MIYLLYFLGFWIGLPLLLYICGAAIDNLLGISLYQIFSRGPSIALFVLILGILLYTRAFIELLKEGKGLPVSAKPPKILTETGPYFWFRHPLYIGFQIILIGIALFTNSTGFMITTGPIFLFLWIIYALIEEKGLLKRYGKTYKRYREETGLLIPSLYSIARLLFVPFFRLFFGLRMMNAGIIPKHGALYVVALHRSFLDPLLISVGIHRKIHFLTTSSMYRKKLTRMLFNHLKTIPIKRYTQNPSSLKKTIEILQSGGIIGIFPEGGRSWYGETAYSPTAIKLIKKHPFPIVSAEIVDNYSYYPRFFGKPKREKLTVMYTLYNQPNYTPEEILAHLVTKEEKRDEYRRKLMIPTYARGIEELIYVCPNCKTLFSIKGMYNGTIKCNKCQNSWMLIKGKAIIPLSHKSLEQRINPITLKQIEEENIAYLKSLELPREGLFIPCKCNINYHRYEKGEIRVFPQKIVIRTKTQILHIEYSSLYSVLIEGNRKLEISYTESNDKKKKGYIILIVPQTKALFLQYFLRIRAFNHPYMRYRYGSRKLVII